MAYLELQHVSKHFSGVAAVQDFNLVVEKGEFISLLGPSGCGKTTTLRMIAGFERPDEGEIFLDDINITPIPPNRRGIGMVFQGYALFPNLTVKDNIAFGLNIARQPKKMIDESVEELLALVRMKEMTDRFPYQLSGGQQQRVALARALAIKPRVLLLDEPLSALDAVVRVALREEIRRIQLELKITTVYVTHDQEEALSMSDRVVVMKEGLIGQIGKPDEIYRQPNSLFVASFIGTANQLRGERIDDHSIRYHGTILRLPENGFGSEVEVPVLLVRPENIFLHAQAPDLPQANILEGKVTTMTFLGPVMRIAVDVDEERIVVDVPAGQDLSISHSQHVWLSFAPETCQVMSE
jgi:putative spermidine/putrescine transport system ATP-binding protein